MTRDLPLFNSILHHHLRPWKATGSEQKFGQLLHSLPKENYHQQPLYEVAFPKPLTAKTRYYKALIDNEAMAFLNKMEAALANAINNNEKKFHIHTALTKKLKGLLTDTQKEIVKQKLYLKTLEDPEQDKQQRDNAWILQYLKYQLIRLYLEIQNSYPEFLNDDALTEEDIHSTYFSENIPEGKLIVIVPTAVFKKPTNKIISAEEILFKPVKGDVREPFKTILTYPEIIAKPDKFAKIEILLFEDQVIDPDYNFIRKQGNVQKLAAYYQVLIKKNYFNRFYFPGKNEVTSLHIRKFLNYRYDVLIDREFRRFNKAEVLEEYFIKNPAPSLIPSC